MGTGESRDRCPDLRPYDITAAATGMKEGEASADGCAGTTRGTWQVTGADTQRPFGIKAVCGAAGSYGEPTWRARRNCRRVLNPSLVKILPLDGPRAEVQRGGD